MGRLIILALLVSALAAAGIVAAGGVTLEPEQQAKIDREAAAPRPVPAEEPIPPAPRTKPVAQPEQGRLAKTLVMDRLHFSTNRVEVEVGESVRWVNRDQVAHELLSDDAEGAGSRPSFSSGTIPRGGSFRATFDTPGLLGYVCTLHPIPMSAFVVVTERQ